VRLPSDFRYWAVLDPTHRVVTEADDFLRHRLGRDGAESQKDFESWSDMFYMEIGVVEGAVRSGVVHQSLVNHSQFYWKRKVVR
jgi:hypothetical protein